MMVTEYWGDIVGGYAQVMGVSNGAMLLLFALAWSIGLALFMKQYTKNNTVGIASFFMVLSFTALLGWISWLIPLVCFVIAGALFFSKGAYK